MFLDQGPCSGIGARHAPARGPCIDLLVRAQGTEAHRGLDAAAGGPDIPEKRVLTKTGDGSNLIQTEVLEQQFIDALRPSSITIGLGARTLTAQPPTSLTTPAVASYTTAFYARPVWR